MKKLIFSLTLSIALMIGANQARAQKFSPVPASPGDVVYFPNDAANKGTAPIIRIDYFRPLKKGRKVFGELLKYGQVWRAGANNQTQVHFFKPVTIGSVSIPAGFYSLFVIPEAGQWTLIVNKQTDRWGSYSYDKSLDVVRLPIPVQKPGSTLEAFSISLEKADDGATLFMDWDDSMAAFPIKF